LQQKQAAVAAAAILRKMKLCVFLCVFVNVVVVVNAIDIDKKCMELAKLDLCTKFFPKETYACIKKIVPHYNKVSKRLLFLRKRFVITKVIMECNFLQLTLDICVTAELQETRCFELRHVCPDYIFVAVYAPNFPKVYKNREKCKKASLALC